MSAQAEDPLFRDRVAKAVSHALRCGRGTALLHLRLQGRNADAEPVLAEIAGRIAACTRYPDSVVQIDGRSFAVLMSEFTRPEEAGLLAMRLGQAVSEAGAGLGACLGIALAPFETEAPEVLMTAARSACEAALAAGEALRFSSEEMNRVARARAEISRDLPRALKAGELRLHYHPQLDLASDRITGAEALLRWQHPTRGLLLPAEFVPLAEAFGPLHRMTAWVLRQACLDARAWPAAEARVAVNLSPRQLEDQSSVDLVSWILDETDLPRHRLELEITESAILGDVAAAARQLQRLRNLGVQLSLDDFGTGYSSLALLKQLPVTKLKIDRTFVAGLGCDVGDTAIVRALIDLGRGLGLEVLAEGVETEAQLAILREAGCTAAQGDLISPPVETGVLSGLLPAAA